MHDPEVHDDCIHFNGYKPCRPHKESGTHCRDCSSYQPVQFRILILKVGLAGEVLRCTPLLRKLRQEYPKAEITWVTAFPDFVPKRWVDRLLKHSWETALRLQCEEFDLLLSLDKDFEVCALAGLIRAKQKRGFGLNATGRIIPLETRAIHKWSTGIWDDLMRHNVTHYPQEIFELCGFSWNGETYILEDLAPRTPIMDRRRLVGLNTGSSNVWTTRLWPEEFWEDLAKQLLGLNYDVVFLGGSLEDSKNQRLAQATGGRYRGVVPYSEFFGQVSDTDLVVTSVTMALHVAIALQKPVVLFNNIFNRHEFHLYGRGEVLEPGLPCQGCYKPRFDDQCPVENCMRLITPARVLESALRWMSEPSS